MNFGQGELGFGAWPRAKSIPVAEYCTVFNASTPIAFDALAMTVCASCAEPTHTIAATSVAPIRLFLSMMPPPFTECPANPRIIVRCPVRDTDPSFSRLVSGKTIAVVGPARTLIGKRHGRHVDSHDLVVRFNDAGDLPSRPDLVPDIGSRTDILYCNQVILRRALADGASWNGLAFVVCTNNSLSFTADGRPEPTCDRQDRDVIPRLAAALARQGS